ncbi:ATPase AAA domain-containing protein 5 [Dispira parvispora]|uniref:ATPase AAA domain-containing protein 5 n=1 Tax=Dispira parvispora TaxID=1520584 RepID=A0A9W8E571_9FUNG|nr:ATPase AAA domain-containing protein 5 [Dispira parvispora]
MGSHSSSYIPPASAPYPTPQTANHGHIPLPRMQSTPLPRPSSPPTTAADPGTPTISFELDATTLLTSDFFTQYNERTTLHLPKAWTTPPFPPVISTGATAKGDISWDASLPLELEHCRRILSLLGLQQSSGEEKSDSTLTLDKEPYLPWVDKYRPTCAEHICGNPDQVNYLVTWLNSWKLPNHEHHLGDALTNSRASSPASSKPCINHASADPAVSPRLMASKRAVSTPDSLVVLSAAPSDLVSNGSPALARSARRANARQGANLTPDGFYRYDPTDPMFEDDETKGTKFGSGKVRGRSQESRRGSATPAATQRLASIYPLGTRNTSKGTQSNILRFTGDSDDDFKPVKIPSSSKRICVGGSANKRIKGGPGTHSRSSSPSVTPTSSQGSQGVFDNFGGTTPQGSADPTEDRPWFPPDRKLGERPPSLILLVGPVGCGKTAAVFACAKQCGYQVLELNAGSRRTGKHVMNILGEVTQNHVVKGVSCKSIVDQWGKLRKTNPVSSPLSVPVQTKPRNTIDRFFGKATNSQHAGPPDGPPCPVKNTKKVDILPPPSSPKGLLRFWKSQSETTPLNTPSPSAEEIEAETSSNTDQEVCVDSPMSSPVPTPVTPKKEESAYISRDQENSIPLGVSPPASPIDDDIIIVNDESDEHSPPSPSPSCSFSLRAGNPPTVDTPSTVLDAGLATSSTSTTQQLLILMEEVDVVYDNDRGFLTAIQSLAKKSKRPMVLTSNSMLSDATIQELGITEILYFKYPSPRALASYMLLLAHYEHRHLVPATVYNICLELQCDMRRTLNQCELYCRTSPKSHPTPSLKAMLQALDQYANQVQTYTSLDPPLVDPATAINFDPWSYAQIVSYPNWAVAWPTRTELTAQLPYTLEFGQGVQSSADFQTLAAPSHNPLGSCSPPENKVDDLQGCEELHIPSVVDHSLMDYHSRLLQLRQNPEFLQRTAIPADIPLDLIQRWATLVAGDPTPDGEYLLLRDTTVSLDPTCITLDLLASHYDHLSALDSQFDSAEVAQLKDRQWHEAISYSGVFSDDEYQPQSDMSLESARYSVMTEYHAHLFTLGLYRTVRRWGAAMAEHPTRCPTLLPSPSVESTTTGDSVLPSGGLLWHTELYHQFLLPSTDLLTRHLHQPSPNATVTGRAIRTILVFPMVLHIYHTTVSTLACDYSAMLREMLANYQQRLDAICPEIDQRSYRRARRSYGQQLKLALEPYMDKDLEEIYRETHDMTMVRRYIVFQSLLKQFSVIPDTS